MTTVTTPPDDADSSRSNRRKACDLCFTKKIKCDMLKPVCSNCILYQADCRTSIVRRKANPARVKAAAKIQQEENGNRVAGLESRLAHIEEQLQLVLNNAKQAHQPRRQSSVVPPTDSSPNNQFDLNDSSDQTMVSSDSESYHNGFTMDEQLQPWKFDPIQPIIYQGPEPPGLQLPPLSEILPVIDHYFNSYNTITPLFHKQTFMSMLNNWYSRPSTRDRVIWSAVQIVMASGYRSPQLASFGGLTTQIKKADECLRNAQSTVSELVTREEDLLGVQILLGIVNLFQNSRDPKPASVIIGTAVRLAHRLRLHSNQAAELYSAAEAEQRSRVFWIAYMLDKDISLRALTPSSQFDDDIDIALPTLTPSDGVGLIWTQDGQTHFNYYRRRVELAHIEGKIYDLLYSNRASKITGLERQRRVTRLQAMLDQWYERIPTVFHMENVVSAVSPISLIGLTKMHHAFLLAEVMTHGIYSHNVDWVRRISSFSHTSIECLSQSLGNKGIETETSGYIRHQSPPLSEGWSKCVDISRNCMRLFQNVPPTECLIWQCSCSHFSGLIVVLANMILFPDHPNVPLDQLITTKAVVLFDKLLQVIDDPKFRSLRGIIGELHEKATKAFEAHCLSEQKSGSDIFAGFGFGDEAMMQESDFLPLGTELEGTDGPFSGMDAGGVDFAFGQGQHDGDFGSGGMSTFTGLM